tara:strand:- start:10 stop:255 length:246 start_codon:yes stop_codon:yes gene_type:complete
MKLSDIVQELGKVQTAKDKPPFKTQQQIENEAVANPMVKKVDFNKPTVIHISDEEMELLHQDRRLEKDGITIIFGDEKRTK